jgi:hypothetical protein
MERKTITTLVMLSILVLTLVTVPAVSACPKVPNKPDKHHMPLRSFMVMSYDLKDPTEHPWRGYVFGDIMGKMEVWENYKQQNYLADTDGDGVYDTEYFFEKLIITTNKGVIQGWDAGVWSFADFKWSAYGEVETATGYWKCLVGCKVSEENGVTTDPFDPNAAAIIGWATITIG